MSQGGGRSRTAHTQCLFIFLFLYNRPDGSRYARSKLDVFAHTQPIHIMYVPDLHWSVPSLQIHFVCLDQLSATEAKRPTIQMSLL